MLPRTDPDPESTPMFVQPVPTLCRDGDSVLILDQTQLPWRQVQLRLNDLTAVAHAIRSMQVRGAPLIGGTAAYGVALAMAHGGTDDAALAHALNMLGATRPTAVNLHWALARMSARLHPLPPAQRSQAAWTEAAAICAEDATTCGSIGQHGLALLRALPTPAGRPLRLMTHCNAGWLATLGAGTALAPVYAAQAAGLEIEVVVSETRPRNQGLLTAWELREAGIPYQLIADNAAGLLIARGEIDIVITGADRIAANGDTANKVGTYLKALAAKAAGIPFHIAAPRSTLDLDCPNGDAIPIEDRGADEVCSIIGADASDAPMTLRLAPQQTRAFNPAFDVTPAGLIDSIFTEHGVFTPQHLGRFYAGAPA